MIFITESGKEIKVPNDYTFTSLERFAREIYQQGREDEKRENEQDVYNRGYVDGQTKCSFDNELKIRADERNRIIKELEEMKCEYDCTANEFQRGANAGANFIRNKAIEIVRGERMINNTKYPEWCGEDTRCDEVFGNGCPYLKEDGCSYFNEDGECEVEE